MHQMLTVEQYDTRERAAITELPNRVVEMVQAFVFNHLGYPVRVHADRELWKYAEVMHETRFERDFDWLLGQRISDSEFGLIKRVISAGVDMTRTSFSQTVAPRSALVRALHVHRLIQNLPRTGPLRCFEIGPGSGYLGCLLLMSGCSYAATDIAQGFYLFQSRLWNHVTGGQLNEMAIDGEWDRSMRPGFATHVPWWEFYRMLYSPVPEVDIVTCNHALCEMHPNSLAMAIRVAKRMLTGSGVKAFVFEGWGYERLVSRAYATRQFCDAGFRLIHNDNEATVFVPVDNEYSAPCAKFPRMPNVRWQALVTALRSGLSGTPLAIRYSPPAVHSTTNQLSRSLLDGRRQRATQGGQIGIEQVNAFYADILGGTDPRSPDEIFSARIGISY